MILVGIAVVAVGAVGCGDDDAGSADAPDAANDDSLDAAGAVVGGDVAGDISIASPAFEFDGEIPAKHALAGENLSPSLTWQVDIDGAEELVVLMEDPDAPGDDPFVHWMVAGLDPASTGIPEAGLIAGAVEGTNDMGAPGYGGPSPPAGERHRYVISLIALDAPSGLEPGFTRADLEAVLEEHFLLSAETAAFFGNEE